MSDAVSAAPSPPAFQSVVLRKLAAVYPDVGPARRKVIAYVLRAPEEVIHLSVTELSKLAGTSEASIVRLFQELGYKGYQDFKIQLSQTLHQRSQRLERDIAPGDTSAAVAASVFGMAVKTLQDTLQVLEVAPLDEAVRLLAGARRIEFIGLEGSGVVALDAYQELARLGVPVGASHDGREAARLCAALEPGDVLVVISPSGSTRDALEAARLAKASGAKVVAITRYGRSPLRSLADTVLFTLSPETSCRSEVMASHIAQLALIDTLLIAVTLQRPPDAQAKLERVRAP